MLSYIISYFNYHSIEKDIIFICLVYSLKETQLFDIAKKNVIEFQVSQLKNGAPTRTFI